MAWWSDTCASLTTDFGRRKFLRFNLFAIFAYSSTPHASNLSFKVGTISVVMTRESVRGYVNTLWRSYNGCIACNVFFHVLFNKLLVSLCNSVNLYKCVDILSIYCVLIF